MGMYVFLEVKGVHRHQQAVIERSSTECCKTKPKYFFWSIATNVNQNSKQIIVTGSNARKAGEQVTIGFGFFLVVWKSGKRFANQSQSVLKRRQIEDRSVFSISLSFHWSWSHTDVLLGA